MEDVPFATRLVSGDTFGEACARGLTDEFVHRLTKTEGLRVFVSSIGFSTETRLERKRQVSMTSEGSVRTEGNHVRVTSRLCDEDGLHIASWCFDAEIDREDLFGTLEKMAAKSATCIRRHSAGEADS
jgi:TolB-like protein